MIHIVGNRPQFIKLAMLHRAIAEKGIVQQRIIHTGQHSSPEMSGIFFNDLTIPAPDVQLRIDNSDPEYFIAEAAKQLKDCLQQEKDSEVIIYGDTNTTHAAAVAAARTGCVLHHIEAGVRTGNLQAPEEVNRLIADRLSSTLYCCTQHNLQTLKDEGFGTAIPARPVFTGDLMLDAYLQIPEAISYKAGPASYIACTIHRAENILIKEHLRAIVAALNHIQDRVPVIVPLHPHTQKKLQAIAAEIKFRIIAPLGYPQMKTFVKNAGFVITDSGGLSREAYFAKKRSLVIMSHPVWPEIREHGAGLSCGPDTAAITAAFSRLAQLQPDFETAIFGKGDAARNICNQLLNAL